MAKLDSVTSDEVDSGWEETKPDLQFSGINSALSAFDAGQITEDQLSNILDMFVQFSPDARQANAS